MPWVAVAGGLASIGSSIVGGITSASDRAKAQSAMDQAIAEINKVGAPPDQTKQIIYEKFKQAGVLTPELEQKIDINVSNLANVKEDPSLRNAQMSALQGLYQRGQTGFSPEDRAAYEKLKNSTENTAEAKTQQILQAAQARGMGTSGTALAGQLQAGQSGASQLSQQGMDVLGQASKNALDALSKYGTMSGQVRAQDFNVNTTRAQAADDLAKFNTQNSLAQQQRNVAAQNQAQQYNLNSAQDAQNKNTATYNSELLREQQAQEQFYKDQLQQAQLKSGIQTGQVGQYNNNAQATGQSWQNIGTGVTGAISAGAKLYNAANQPDYTTNTNEDDADAKRKQEIFGSTDPQQ